MMNHYTLAFILLSGLLAGCSSTPIYPNNHEKNVTINLRLDGDKGLFKYSETYVGVNRLVGDRCNAELLGVVTLTPGSNEIGLRPGERTFLKVIIINYSINGDNVFSRGAVILPQADRNYAVDVHYVNHMFDFRLYEVTSTGRKEMKLVNQRDCMSVGPG